MSSHPDRECPLDGNDWPPRGCDCSHYSLPMRVFISRMLVDLGDRGGGLFLCKAAGVGRKSPIFMDFLHPFLHLWGLFLELNKLTSIERGEPRLQRNGHRAGLLNEVHVGVLLLGALLRVSLDPVEVPFLKER